MAAGLVKRILDAHGGEAAWRGVERLFASCSLGGMEFVARMQPAPLREVQATVAARKPHVQLAPAPYGSAGECGYFTAEQVWIEDQAGEVTGERAVIGNASGNLRHGLWWDRLDVLCQAGAIIWFALNVPGLLLHRSVTCEELSPVRDGQWQMERLRVSLAAEQAVHGAEHVLYADSMGIIRRVDSRALVYGGMFSVSQIWEGHETFDGLLIATERSYYPSLFIGWPWQVTRLIWLTMDDISVSRSRA